MEQTPVSVAVAPEAPQQCGLATVSLAMGILSFCLGPFGAVPAIICGVIALNRIRSSQGYLRGKGLAIAGLALGAASIFLFVIVVPATIVLMPALARAREAGRRAECAQNLKQMGLVCQAFAKDEKDHYYPELSSVPGRLMCTPEDIYPKYLPDARVLVCPSDPDASAKSRGSGVDPVTMINDDSYVYLGYVITTDDEMQAFVEAYRRRVAQRLPFNEDLEAPPGRGSMGTDKFYRLREGVEKELLKGNPTPAAVATLQSQIPVMWDRMESTRNAMSFNHIPGGANVLFLDGHVEFRRYPGPWPVSKGAPYYLDGLVSMRP